MRNGSSLFREYHQVLLFLWSFDPKKETGLAGVLGHMAHLRFFLHNFHTPDLFAEGIQKKSFIHCEPVCFVTNFSNSLSPTFVRFPFFNDESGLMSGMVLAVFSCVRLLSYAGKAHCLVLSS